jgi:DNA-binding transcriptional LysR family regulator
MQPRHLRTFLAVATTRNFTKSAEQLHLAQSSVTEQIQTLETTLGTELFNRTQRRLELTPAGQQLVDYARRILELIDEARVAVAAAGRNATGQIAIGGLETLCAEWLPAAISRYNACCPDVRVILRSANSSELRRHLKDETLDLCFSFGFALDDPELRSEQLAEATLVIIAPGARAGHEHSAADLLNESFLVTEAGCIYRRMFDQAFATTLPERPRITAEVGSINAACAMVQSGLGYALVPELAASAALQDGRLSALPWIGKQRTVPITVSWNPRQSMRPALKLFLDAAREH